MTTQTYNQNDSSFQSQSSSQSRPDYTSRLARAYREIGIKSGATLQTVEKRIRKLISDNHPDKFQTPQIKERQTEWLKTLNAHRELLIGHFRDEHPNAQDKCFCCDDQKTQVIRTTNAKAASAGKTTPPPSSDISKELAKQLDALVSPFKSTKDARRRKLVLAMAIVLVLDLAFMQLQKDFRDKKVDPPPQAISTMSKPSPAISPTPTPPTQPASRLAYGMSESEVYFKKLALDRCQMAIWQDRRSLEQLAIKLTDPTLSPSQRRELEEMREFREIDLQKQQQMLSTIESQLSIVLKSEGA